MYVCMYVQQHMTNLHRLIKLTHEFNF
jgi:hypothetical protein